LEKNNDAKGGASMLDLFGAPEVNGNHYIKPVEDPFRWVVSMFAQDGATQTIIRSNKLCLATYYPIRFNSQGVPVPLFKNYLFVEWREGVTIEICRATSLFVRVLSARDDEGIVRPILVRRTAIDENKAMVMASKFNERIIERRFYGRGSIVAVLHGIMATRKVRLEENVTPQMRGSHRVRVDMDGVKGTIELHKLAL
jgi:hypothetical protein